MAFVTINYTEMLLHIRRQCQIPGTSGMSDTDIASFLNDKYLTWMAATHDKQTTIDGTSAIPYAAGSRSIVSPNVNTIFSVLRVTLQTDLTAGATREPMTYRPWNWLADMQGSDDALGKPTHWSERWLGTASRSFDAKEFSVWPIPDLTYYLGVTYILDVSSLSGSNLTPLVDRAEAYWIADFAAVAVAPLVGKSSEFADRILAGIPDHARSRMNRPRSKTVARTIIQVEQ